jgi:hypothetical protein
MDIQSVHAVVNVPAATNEEDAAKRVPGRKLGLVVDVLGLVIAVTVLAASAHGNAFGIVLLGQVAPIGTVKKALVDQGFKKTVVDHGTRVGVDVEIVGRNRADKGAGLVLQAKRWIVEQTLGILMLFWRLVRDDESRPKSSESRVCWAVIDVVARWLTGSPAGPRRPGAGDRMGDQVAPLLARIGARERQLVDDAAQIRAQMNELTVRLCELDEEIESLAVTRKTLLALPPTASEPADPPPVLPAHPVYQQILDVFADAAGPMRARDLCQALDLPLTPKNVESTRHKLKRLVSLGVLAETEPGLFAQRCP